MEIKILKVGDIVEGKVVEVTDNTILIDVKYFTEARMHIDNYDPSLDTFANVVKEGDTVKGRIQKITEEPPLILMSRLPIIKKENFNLIVDLVESKEEVDAKVKKVAEKGILLDYLGYEVFLPFTLLDYELIEEKAKLKGKVLKINIIEASRRGRFTRIIGSRKEIFERERKEAYEQRMEERQQELDSINTGDILTGTIDKLEKHAANVRFENIVGLLRISQVSHYRIDKLEDVLTEGQEVQVKVIKKEGNRLDLSMKALVPTPFEEFAAKNSVGDEVTGKVVQKLPFGLIVEVAQDVRGLLHKNEYSWNPNDNFDSHVNIDDEITLAIIRLDLKSEKIGLSKRQLEDNPWKNVTFKRGDIVSAEITDVKDSGLEVLVDGINGFIPANEALRENANQISAYFSVGDKIDQALVTEANHKNWNLRLSIVKVLEKKDRETFEKYLESEEENSGQTIGDLIGEDLKE